MINLVPQRLAALRAVMRERGIAYCIVPTADPHLSEYLAGRWRVREWLSGFTGSAGTLVVGADFAGLWTDSRYFEQAQRQLVGSGIELMRLSVPHTPEHVQWLVEHMHEGERVACAADMLSLTDSRALRERLAERGAHLVHDDLPALIWADRPALPNASIFEHPLEFATRTRVEKLTAVRLAMNDAGATHHLVSALDEVAWLTNLRGADVDYNPVFLAHLLIEEGLAILFVDERKLQGSAPPSARGGRLGGGQKSEKQPSLVHGSGPAILGRALVGAECDSTHSASNPDSPPVNGGGSLISQLRADGFIVSPYANIDDALRALTTDARLLLDSQHIAASIAASIDQSVRIIEAPGPIAALKARKHDAELAYVRVAMRHDGVALVRAARWLEQTLARGERVTELDVDNKLRELRAGQPGFVSESFSTIAGYEANAALPHYRATPESHAQLQSHGMLLIDSGAQYLGGTTDITRMWALGETTAEQRGDVTLVLKGVIALSRAKFPRGASGQQLDALARAPIWAAGLDYGHGTGHGVGYFLNVHEGPQAIRPPRSQSHLEPLDIGMITSIEPGIYKSGRHGVRIENLVAVVADGHTECGEFLRLETLTLCPIDTRLLDAALLGADDIAWLDGYHVMVRERLTPLLEDAADRYWLDARCLPIANTGA